MRTTIIVFLSPGPDQLFCLSKSFEPVHVEAFIAKGPVERFHEGVICRLARAGEVDLHTILVSPQVHCLPAELTAVVTEQQLRRSALLFQPIHGSHYVFSTQTLSHFDGHAFPGKHIEHGQEAEPPAVLQLVGNEIDAPGLIRSGWLESLFSMAHRFAPFLGPSFQGKSFFLVEPIHQVLAYFPPFASKQYQNFPIAVADPALRDLADPGS